MAAVAQVIIKAGALDAQGCEALALCQRPQQIIKRHAVLPADQAKLLQGSQAPALVRSKSQEAAKPRS